MSDALRRHVESELLLDVAHYRTAPPGEILAFDWSNPCQEGHEVESLGGRLESMSDVVLRDESGVAVAEGWLDFVGAASGPPYVFWLFLDLADPKGMRSVKEAARIPAHVWLRLPDVVKDGCVAGVDPIWRKDPLVAEWSRRS